MIHIWYFLKNWLNNFSLFTIKFSYIFMRNIFLKVDDKLLFDINIIIIKITYWIKKLSILLNLLSIYIYIYITSHIIVHLYTNVTLNKSFRHI